MTRRETRSKGHGGAALLVVAAMALAACSSGGEAADDSGTDEAAATTDDDADRTDRTDRTDTGDPDETDHDTGDDDSSTAPETRTDTAAPDDEAPDAIEPPPIEWERYNDAVDVGTIEVPVNYDDPTGAQFELRLARYNAINQDDKIGSLLVNRGGPGFGTSDYAIYAAQIFDRELLENFDIIGWDPRGTGESTPPIDCVDDFDPYVNEIDSTPDDDAERAALAAKAQDFIDQCMVRSRGIIEYVGTNNSARDIDVIRKGLGEDQISFFGFSYGSELGGAWATLFPDTVRAAVFDGAVDPDADSLQSSLEQTRGFANTLDTFLAQCSADTACAFYNDGDAEAAYDTLMVELDTNPIPGAAGRPLVNRDVATDGVRQAMYLEAYWPALAESLAAAQRGDGSGLLALSDNYYQRGIDGTYGNELEAFQIISCADTPERKTVEEVDAQGPLYTEVAPRLVPPGSVGGYFCTFVPAALDPRVDITAAGAGPILVIGTTGDPATPFESTAAMADSLEDGRLVLVEADEHTGYGINRCIVDVVNRYLIDLEPPDSGKECR